MKEKVARKVVLLCAILSIFSLSALASTGGHSQSEAVDWAKSKVGQEVIYYEYHRKSTGGIGGQCTDFIAQYYIYLGQSVPGGNGADYATNKLPSGWTRVKSNPQPGDIAVWNNDTYGHVGVVISANSEGFKTVEQNYQNQNYCTNVDRKYSYPMQQNHLVCFVRPDFSYAPFVPTYKQNISTTAVSHNLSDGAFPSGLSTVEVGKSYYFNAAVSSDYDLKKMELFIKTAADSSFSCRYTDEPEQGKSLIRWANVSKGIGNAPGTLQYYWILTSTGGQTFQTKTENVTVKGPTFTPTYKQNISATAVSHNLSDGAFPSGLSTVEVGKDYYFNAAVSSDYDLKKMELFIKTAEDSSFSNRLTDEPEQGKSLIRWANVIKRIGNAPGTLQYYWILTSTGGQTYRTNTESVTVKGTTVKPVSYYTVSFSPNGATGSMSAKIVADGGTLTLPACTFTAPTGKQFKIWRIGTTDYAPGASYTVTANTTVTAVWEDIPAPVSGAAIMVDNTTARKGGTVSVPIRIKDNPGVASMRLDVSYDRAVMTLTDVSDGGLIGTTNHNPNKSVYPYTLSWENDTATADFTNDGMLVTLTFSINENAAEGNYAVTASYDADDADILNHLMQPVAFQTRPGTVTVTNTLPGDVNGDGKVNAIDRITLSRYLAKWTDYGADSIDALAADVNGDGKVNSMDRIILSRHLAKWENYLVLSYQG